MKTEEIKQKLEEIRASVEEMNIDAEENVSYGEMFEMMSYFFRVLECLNRKMEVFRRSTIKDRV